MKRKKAKLKINLILTVAFLAVACYFFVSFFQLRSNIARTKAEVNEIEAKTAEVQEKNDDLQRLLDEGDLDSFVEKRARDEDLGYAYPDERVYYDMAAGQ